jgi:hypothetical protein
MNATPDLMPKITPGAYDSNSYVVPVADALAKRSAHWRSSDAIITHYLGPTEYPPENPDPYGYDQAPVGAFLNTPTWDVSSASNVTIDGQPGSLLIFSRIDNIHTPNCRIFAYSTNPSTFVTIKSNMDWDKDISLAIETLHITEKKT